jgi:hypothetical protein
MFLFERKWRLRHEKARQESDIETLTREDEDLKMRLAEAYANFDTACEDLARLVILEERY